VRPYKIIISGGGTGGHIYPAIAIANECVSRWPDTQILFVGASDRMEMEKVPAAGYQIKGLWISGLQRSLSVKNLTFPFKVMKSLYDAGKIINSFQPDVAVGTGGYASGPLLYMAIKKRIPAIIQEQNSFPGITNKLLGKKVTKICVASPDLERFFPEEKLILTGNPVRQDLLDIAPLKKDAQHYFNLDTTRKTLLVLGGSLGARRINQLIATHRKMLQNQVNIIWQTGKLYISTYRDLGNDRMYITDFLPRMDLAYAAADFIISRAGAGTISELAIVGKPVIFIPSPHVAEDHQTKNALAITQKEAALMIKETDLEQNFSTLWKGLLEQPQLQDKLSKNFKKLALPDATRLIVNEIEQLLK
jgi:UDP-N-acetylglucosamine--N-acetylmuramyl-(pentapeptide) pyrophosphoryl-undecaprenol N-acetylglucosamine transferase